MLFLTETKDNLFLKSKNKNAECTPKYLISYNFPHVKNIA